MDSLELKNRIRKEIGDKWNETNLHQVRLSDSLVEPKKIKIYERTVIEGEVKDIPIEVWLVLEEDPKEKNGYKIVYSEDFDSFGLADTASGKENSLISWGWYGGFWETFKGM